jgi:signal transduction histidine kinase
MGDRVPGRRGWLKSHVLAHGAILACCAFAAFAVGTRVEQDQVDAFVERSTHDATITLELVDAFVSAYAAERARLSPDQTSADQASADQAAVPATFRAHALARFAAERRDADGISITMVGMAGRSIATPPYDDALAASLDRLEATGALAPVTELVSTRRRTALRTMMPSIANQPSCVECHNHLQAGPIPAAQIRPGQAQADGTRWRLGGMMGALVVDTPADAVLAAARRDGLAAGGATLLGTYLIAFAAILLVMRAQRRLAQVKRTAEERIVGAIEGLSAGVALFDRNDQLIVANPAYRRMHAVIADVLQPGVTFETIVRANVRRRRVDLGGDEAERYIARRLAQHQNPGAPIERRLANGNWEQVREQRLADGGIALVILDITKEKEREAMLEAARDAAEGANRSKSNFLANMSHELRTPLNAIIGFADVIKTQLFGTDAGPRYADYAHDISSSASHLMDVINDVLDMAKIEAGRYTIEVQDISIADVVASCLTIVTGRATSGRIALDSIVDDDLPPIQADPRAIKQVLLNLLANAVKFTPAGGAITLDARLDKQGDLTITVADTGIGIPADQLARICEPFHQVESSLARKHGGTGLGLSISRRLIELHGGTLDIASVPGVGTTVTVRLPAALVIAMDTPHLSAA